MRIVAGQWRGRRIEAPAGRETRPTSDRVREAVFSAVSARLGPLDECVVLDLYAGSGALGIEAMSRGADHVTFVESDRRAVECIRGNLRVLEVPADRYEIVHTSVERLDAGRLPRRPVSLLCADPPYRIDAADVSQVLEALGAAGVLACGALVVYEHAAHGEMRWPDGFIGDGTRAYGDTVVSYARYGS